MLLQLFCNFYWMIVLQWFILPETKTEFWSIIRMIQPVFNLSVVCCPQRRGSRRTTVQWNTKLHLFKTQSCLRLESVTKAFNHSGILSFVHVASTLIGRAAKISGGKDTRGNSHKHSSLCFVLFFSLSLSLCISCRWAVNHTRPCVPGPCNFTKGRGLNSASSLPDSDFLN